MGESHIFQKPRSGQCPPPKNPGDRASHPRSALFGLLTVRWTMELPVRSVERGLQPRERASDAQGRGGEQSQGHTGWDLGGDSSPARRNVDGDVRPGVTHRTAAEPHQDPAFSLVILQGSQTGRILAPRTSQCSAVRPNPEPTEDSMLMSGRGCVPLNFL